MKGPWATFCIRMERRGEVWEYLEDVRGLLAPHREAQHVSSGRFAVFLASGTIVKAHIELPRIPAVPFFFETYECWKPELIHLEGLLSTKERTKHSRKSCRSLENVVKRSWRYGNQQERRVLNHELLNLSFRRRQEPTLIRSCIAGTVGAPHPHNRACAVLFNVPTNQPKLARE